MTNRDSNLLAIKEGLYSISKQMASAPKSRATNDIKALASKIYNSIQSGSDPVERFYFIYLVCQICSDKPTKLDKFMKIVIPSQVTPQLMILLSDLICFAVCHSTQYACLLDYLGDYVSDSESIEIQVESWSHAETLALESPKFCSLLLSRLDIAQLGIDKKLLSKWLQDLSKMTKAFPKINLTHIIRYSLFDDNEDTIDSDLHFGILTIIQSNRCHDLTNPFLIDIINSLANKLELQESSTDQKIDHFAQILSVAAANRVASISNPLKIALAKLDCNQIVAAIIKF